MRVLERERERAKEKERRERSAGLPSVRLSTRASDCFKNNIDTELVANKTKTNLYFVTPKVLKGR